MEHDRAGFANRRASLVVVVATTLILIGVGALLALRSDDTTEAARRTRQAVVESRGADVMPFDQSKTTHTFDTTSEGGVETVTANDPGDETQIALIRMHLAHESQLFAAGDFTDPATIHGENMPGLAELQRSANEIEFAYVDVPRGAAITYRTTNPALVTALHTWFDAQLNDHGRHAHG
jgi:hypothetical protein